MAYTPVSGNDGRVTVGSNVAVAGLTEWKMTKKTTSIKVPHFEMSTDSDGNLWTNNVVRGLSEANVTFAGYVDTNSTTATDSGTPGLSNGLTVTMDFILVKATPWGFSNCSVFIESVEIGTNINNQAGSFAGSGFIIGTPGKTTTTT